MINKQKSMRSRLMCLALAIGLLCLWTVPGAVLGEEGVINVGGGEDTIVVDPAPAEVPAPTDAPVHHEEAPAPTQAPVAEPTHAPTPAPTANPESANAHGAGFFFAMSEGDQADQKAMRPSKSVYLVSFLSSNDTPYFISEVEEGLLVENPDFTPEMEGYTFQYWFNIYAHEWLPYDFSMPISCDLFLRAMFARDEMPEDVAAIDLESDFWNGGGVSSNEVVDFVLGLGYTISMEGSDEEFTLEQLASGENIPASGYSFLDIIIVDDDDEIDLIDLGGDGEEDDGIDLIGLGDGEEDDGIDLTDLGDGEEDDGIDLTGLGDGEEDDGIDLTDLGDGEEDDGIDLTDLGDGEEDGEEEIVEAPVYNLDSCSVRVYSSHSQDSWIVEGDIIEVWGELSGFDNIPVTFQWRYNDGNGWVDVPGATSLRYAFVATAESVTYNWRLAVIVETPETAESTEGAPAADETPAVVPAP